MINLPDFLSYDAYGDSITEGNMGYTYLDELHEADPGWTINNYGVGGAFIADYSPLVLGRDIETNSVSSLLIGTGDANWMNSPDYYDIFYHEYLLSAAWLTIPNANKKLITSPDVTTHGDWEYLGLWSGLTGTPLAYFSTSEPGASVTISNLHGTDLLIGVLCKSTYDTPVFDQTGPPTVDPGTFSIAVDGVYYGEYATLLPTNTTSNSGFSQSTPAYGIELNNLSDKQHVVTLTQTSDSGTVSFLCAMDYSSTGQGSFTGPYFYAFSLIEQGQDYLAGQADWGDTPDSIIYRNSLIQSISDKLAAHGLNSVYVDLYSEFCPDSMLLGDGLHENYDGSVCMANVANGAFHPNTGLQGDFYYDIRYGSAVITQYIGSNDTVTVPSQINGWAVTEITDYAFYGQNFTTVILPDNLSFIDSDAFANCASLATLRLADNVTSIGSYAFADCASLATLRLPDNVTFIGSYAFVHCASLTTLRLPGNVTSIGDHAFDSCQSLKNLQLSGTLAHIGNFAWASCVNLTNLYIPAGVTFIGTNAFSGCSRLTNIVIAGNGVSISANAFRDCNQLQSVFLLGNVNYLGDNAFYEFSSDFTSVYFAGDAPVATGQNVFYSGNATTVYYKNRTTGWTSTFAGQPTAPWPQLTSRADGGAVVITWPRGVLQESTNLLTGWQISAQQSPCTNPAPTLQKFYRLKLD